MQSKAATVDEYLSELPVDRRLAISAVREVILKNLDKGYIERMSYGMIGYAVPHSLFPAGYHCDPKMPLPFAGLASQKQYMSLYLAAVYSGYEDPLGAPSSEYASWFASAWKKSGKKLDMGKCCIRFKKLEDIPLEVVGEAIRRLPVKVWIEHYEKALVAMDKAKAQRKAAGRNAAGKRSAKAASTPPSAKKPSAKKIASRTTTKPARKTAKKAGATSAKK